jgi:ACS family tartrate transporter-like MFS transporter
MNSLVANPQESQAFGERVLRKVSWRLIPLMMMLYFVAFLDRVNVGFAALTMNKDLALSAAVFGNGAGIFFVGYCLCEVPSNIMLDKLGARKWIARIMITWGLISAGMSFAQGPHSFYLLRFLLGAAEAGLFPGLILYLTYWFPSSYRGKIIGSFMIAIPLSSIIGAPISGALLGVQGLGLHGWQWMFILEGLPSVVIGFFVWFGMTDRPEKATWLTQPEKDWLVGIQAAEQKMRESVHRFTLAQVLIYPRVLLLGVVHSGMQVALYGFSFWLPQMIKSLGGLTNLQVGFITMIPYLFGAAAMYFWGRHSDRKRERVWHVATAGLCGGIGLAGSAYLGSSPVLALVALTISAMGIMAMYPTFWTLPTSMLSGKAAAGGIALISAIGNLLAYFGPSIMGYLKGLTNKYTYGLLALAAFIVCSSILTVIMGQNPALEKSEMMVEGTAAKAAKA